MTDQVEKTVPPRPFALLADTGGPISLAACAPNIVDGEIVSSAAAVEALRRALTERTRLLMLAPHTELLPRDDRILRVDVGRDTRMTVFAQDPMLVLTDAIGRPTLLCSQRFDRREDQRMGHIVAEALRIECRQSALAFEGGNVVGDETYAFVGANTIHVNAEALSLSARQAGQRFSSELGRPVIVVGPFPQPVWHIDMILTPLGEGKLLLADAGLGAELAERDLRDSPRTVAGFERRCESPFAGIGELKDPDGRVIGRPRVVGGTAEAIAAGRAIAESLDRLSDHLARSGFQVARIPFLSAGSRTAPPAARRASGPRLFSPNVGYPTFSYNNVLMEKDRAGRTVYLPQYGWPALDAAGRQAWEALGYDVRPIGGLTTTAMVGGSLRCCVKVLRRAVNLLAPAREIGSGKCETMVPDLSRRG